MRIASSPAWFSDETALLAELQRASAASRGALPSIPGYDDLAEIRRGGQGVVYGATQRSTKRRVAIKVLLEGSLASPSSRRRFEREIDLVAGLRHPGIVRVYDSGITELGWPYFVMEFIEGLPLDEWARAQSASAPARRAIVVMFVKIADAVTYAHQRGVIHRDLKPSNVRVDPQGEPHVLDFGLAKAAEGHREGVLATAVSTSGQFLGSLPWASPEQAAGDLERIDVRSDVYSLGVMLYESLSGQRPYDVTGSLTTALQTIQHAPPKQPSAIAAWIDADLETILLRSLAKEPARRYPSMADLAADLRAWLDGEPIAARRDGAWYLLRVAARRHRALVAAAGTLVIAGIAFGAVMTVLYARTLRAERQAREALVETEAARDRAESAGRQQLATNDFLNGMLTSADPGRDGREVKVVDVLGKADTLLKASPPSDRLVEASVRTSLGMTYSALGQWTEGMAQLWKASEIRRGVLGELDPDTLRPRLSIPSMLANQGKLDEAERVARENIEAGRKMGAPGESALASSLAISGQVMWRRSRLDEAVQFLTQATEIQERLKATDAASRDSLPATLNDLGVALRTQGKYSEAETALRHSLVALKDSGQADAGTALQAENNLALAIANQGRLDEAVKLLGDLEPRFDKVLGRDHPDTITFRSNLATFYMDKRRLVEAERVFREALEAEKRVRGERSPSAMTIKNNLARCLQETGGRLAEAESLLREVVRDRTEVLGPEHAHTLIANGNLAGVLTDQGRSDEALPLLRSVLAVQERTLGPAAFSTLVTLNNLGRTLTAAKQYDEAATIFKKCLAGTATTLKPDDYRQGLFTGNYGRCLMGMGQWPEAEAQLREAVRILTKAFGVSDPRVRQNLTSLAEVCDHLNRTEEAASIRKQLSEAAPLKP